MRILAYNRNTDYIIKLIKNRIVYVEIFNEIARMYRTKGRCTYNFTINNVEIKFEMLGEDFKSYWLYNEKIPSFSTIVYDKANLHLLNDNTIELIKGLCRYKALNNKKIGELVYSRYMFHKNFSTKASSVEGFGTDCGIIVPAYTDMNMAPRYMIIDVEIKQDKSPKIMIKSLYGFYIQSELRRNLGTGDSNFREILFSN